MSLLELKGISKSFGKNTVLTGVDFSLNAGEIHALLGENGAGKSTLLNIIGGVLHPENGHIFIEEKEVSNLTIQKAKELGIGFVHQEIELCQDVTVAENIMMASICDSKSLNINLDKIVDDAKEILKSLVGNKIDPKSMVSNLSISQQQIVEIAKALSYKCKILLLDEPTAALSEDESQALFQVMKKLTQNGIGIIFISHRMSELFKYSDRVTVLRDGRVISTYELAQAKMAQLISDMAGREVSDIFPDKSKDIKYTKENELLKVENLSDKKGRFENVDFTLYKGQILGVAGLVGAGRTEIMQNIVNLRQRSGGTVTFLNENIDNLTTAQIYKKGLVLLSEDRKKTGLFLDYSIKSNVCSTFIEEVTDGLFINRTKETKLANSKIKELTIRCSDENQSVRNLSGGNQQKVLLGKLLAKNPKVVILDEPTRGVDAVAKVVISHYIRDLARKGIGVILISSEMNELIGMCDKLIFIDIDGDQVKEEVNDQFNSDQILYYISGAYKCKEEQA